MTGKELYAKLVESGTRGERLTLMEGWLEEHPGWDAKELYEAMERHGWPPFGEVTLKKARDFAGILREKPKPKPPEPEKAAESPEKTEPEKTEPEKTAEPPLVPPAQGRRR